MNQAVFIGRMTKDPELRRTQNGDGVANFTLAVDRDYKDADGNRPADFLPCVAWRKTGEFIAEHMKKGMKVAVIGSVQTRSYTAQDGTKRNITEVVVDHIEFCERKQAQEPAQEPGAFTPVDDPELTF